MKQTKKRKAKRRLPLVSKLGLVLLALAVMYNGYTLAKYLKEQKGDNLYTAKAFYFTSDYLQPMQSNGKYVLYTLQEGETSLSLQLRSYDDSLRFSDVPIEYKVCINGTEKAELAGELAAGSNSAAVTINGIAGQTYTVTAEAVSPYSKTIGAQFAFVGTTNEIEYTSYGSSDNPALQLTVRTNDYSGDVTLSWGDGIYPDKTDPMLKDAAYGDNGSCTVTLGCNTEYTFRFLKSDLNKPTVLSAAKAN